MQLSTTDKKWLVKVENRILGPFSYEEIEDLLKKKQLSLIDEIRDMDTRWMYVRESEALQAIVDEIRQELANTDDHTKTYQTRTAYSVTKTDTITKDALQGENTKFKMPDFTNVKIEESEFVEAQITNEVASKSSPAGLKLPNISKSNYVSSSDPHIRRQIIDRSKLTFMILVAVIITLVVGAAGSYYYQLRGAKKQEQQTLLQLRRSFLYGLDDKVIDAFSNMSPEVQKKVLPEIIPMLPKLESAGLINGIQVINSLKSNTSLNDQRKSLLDLIQFVQALQDQDLKKARVLLISAKNFDPSSDSVKENDAILSYYESKLSDSSKLFTELYKRTAKGRWLFGFAVSEMAKPTIDMASEDALRNEIELYTNRSIEYKKQLLLINMLISKKINKETDFLKYYASYVDMPLNFEKKFRIPAEIFSTFYSSFTIKSIFEKLKPFLTAKQKFLIEMHIKLEAGDLSSAQALFMEYKNIIDDRSDLENVRLQLDFALKDYTAVVAQEKIVEFQKMNTAGHVVMMLSKLKINTQSTSLIEDTNIVHINYLKKANSLLGLWAELINLEQSKKFAFVQTHYPSYEDFIPFLEVKGTTD